MESDWGDWLFQWLFEWLIDWLTDSFFLTKVEQSTADIYMYKAMYIYTTIYSNQHTYITQNRHTNKSQQL